ncbi:hypothetical protein SI65_02225 [Aspergillus cristatus]|uniref:Uncharacterized protein n=1 Tax=Aspergillus cristatus TaxID=573508 RepID=A0A1E3BK71_ASPCR|nr:hypothetical protein SI65_02225 [Aspergillus cristatus]
MPLTHLPIEVLWTTASYLSRQSDIYALIKTNRHLYNKLNKFLYYFNTRYKNGAALSFAAEHNNFFPVVAIRGGYANIVTLLRDRRARVNFYRGNRVQCLEPQYTRKWWRSLEVDHPPLFVAVQAGHLERVKVLLGRGADADMCAPSPLYRTVEDDRRDIVPVLLEHGVGPQMTALKLAVLRGDESMVRLLLDGGLKVPEYGYAALYTAKMKGGRDMVDLLESRGATLAALGDIEKRNWAKEDGDGTRRPIFQRMFISDETEVKEDDEDDED